METIQKEQLIILTKNKQAYLKTFGNLLQVSGVSYSCHEFYDQIPDFREGTIVLGLGKAVLEAYQLAGHLPKNRAVTSLRGSCYEIAGTKVLFSFDPYLVCKEYQFQLSIEEDTNLAIRLCKTGTLQPVIGSYSYVKDFSEIVEFLEAQYKTTKKAHSVTLDLETVGLNEWDASAWIVSISFTVFPGVAHVVYFAGLKDQPKKGKERDAFYSTGTKIHEQVEWLCNTERVKLVGANLKFDTRWLKKKWGIDVTNFVFDTHLVGSLIDENAPNNLTTHSHRYTQLGGYDSLFNKHFDKSQMQKVPKADLLPYIGGDTDSCYQVFEVLKGKLLQDSSLTRFYVELLHPAVRVFEKVEMEGILIDLPYFLELQKELADVIEALEETACSLMSPFIKNKYHGIDKGGKNNLRLSRPKVIKDFMFGPRGLNLTPKVLTPKAQEPSTAYDHLIMFEANPKAKVFIETLKAHNSAAKTLSTYVIGFLKHLRSDGRFHPSYFFFKGDDETGGSLTGRSSAVDPAVQCLEGSMRVLTNKGWVTIQDVVTGYEQGSQYKVITHTGKIQPVIGVYRNGIKPVFTLLFEQSKIVVSTGNHPYLTDRGWVRADELNIGDNCYALKRKWFRSSDEELHQSNLLQLESNEMSVPQQGQQRLQELRRARYSGVQALAPVPELFERYGGEAGEGVVNREERCQRELCVGELHMGDCFDASFKSQEQQVDILQGEDSNESGLGKGVRYQPRETPLSFDRFGIAYGNSLDEGEVFKCGVFERCKVVSTTPAGCCETYDITVQDSHSFVAEGVVVHNTIPSHTAWSKKLRKGYIAPDGWSVVNLDYSQGELRIAACLAKETTMIKLYQGGYDLHAVAGGKVVGYSLSDMMEMKTQDLTLYKEIRQSGKACIAEGVKVKTDRGDKCIESVGFRDRLWDGIDWVSHEGIEFQGHRYVMSYGGVEGTPEHIVYTEVGAMPLFLAWELQVAIIEETSANVHISFFYGSIEERDYLKGRVHADVTTKALIKKAEGYGFQEYIFIDGNLAIYAERYKKVLVYYRSLQNLSGEEGLLCRQLVEWEDNKLCMSKKPQVQKRYKSRDFRRAVRCDGAAVQKHWIKGPKKLWCPWDLSQISRSKNFYKVHVARTTPQGLQGGGYRPQRQQWALRKGQLEISYQTFEFAEYPQEPLGKFSGIQSAYVCFGERNTEGAAKVCLCGEHSEQPYTLGAYTRTAFEKMGKSLPIFTLAKTYDPINAGRNHRFTLCSGATVAQCNFGLLYGMSAGGLKEYARTAFGVILTEQDAKNQRAAFFELFDRLLPWHEEQKKTARRYGAVRNPFGRVRHLPMIDSPDNEARAKEERRSINSPVQSGLSDLTIFALKTLDAEYEDLWETCRAHCFTHDNLMFYIRNDKVFYWVPRIKEVMENLPLESVFGWKPQLKFEVDAEVGNTWADLMDFTLFLQQHKNKLKFS